MQSTTNFPLKNQSNIQNKELEYTTSVNYICINSSDRNTSKYPNVNTYRIELSENFRNVHSIEIVSASLANQNNIQLLPYVILKLEGLDHINFSNDNNKKGFAILYLKPTTGAHVLPELGVLQRNVLINKTPISSLSNIQISLCKPDGSALTFGESNGDITVAYSNSFLLKITTVEVSRKSLHNMSVY